MMLRRFWANIRGATAVEFAITAPVFFALLFGIVDGGRLLWTQVGLQHAVEMAARCASIDNTTLCSDVPAYAATEAFGLDLPAAIFTVSTGACDGVQVSANYQFTFATGFFGPGSLTLSAQSCVPKLS